MHKRNRAGGPQFAPKNHTWQDMRRDTWQHFNMGEGSHLHRTGVAGKESLDSKLTSSMKITDGLI